MSRPFQRHLTRDTCLGEQSKLTRIVERALLQPLDKLFRRVVKQAQRRELRVLVVRVVAARLIELDLADVGRIDRLIAAAEQLVLEEVLEHAADDRPFGHPEDQARTDEGRDRE